jgi:hypothetical protein
MKSWKLIRGLVRSLLAQRAGQADRNRIGKRIGATFRKRGGFREVFQELL